MMKSLLVIFLVFTSLNVFAAKARSHSKKNRTHVSSYKHAKKNKIKQSSYTHASKRKPTNKLVIRRPKRR